MTRCALWGLIDRIGTSAAMEAGIPVHGVDVAGAVVIRKRGTRAHATFGSRKLYARSHLRTHAASASDCARFARDCGGLRAIARAELFVDSPKMGLDSVLGQE